MARLPRPLPPYDVNADRYPDDDLYIEQWKITMLNRIDQEYGCGVMVQLNHNEWGSCGVSEWEPFSNRCYDHTPGVMHSWDM